MDVSDAFARRKLRHILFAPHMWKNEEIKKIQKQTLYRYENADFKWKKEKKKSQLYSKSKRSRIAPHHSINLIRETNINNSKTTERTKMYTESVCVCYFLLIPPHLCINCSILFSSSQSHTLSLSFSLCFSLSLSAEKKFNEQLYKGNQ